jgi:site-specific DNA-methyltransferase (adenine-specific)
MNINRFFMQELLNKRQQMDGLQLLQKIPSESIRVVFFDPQYRGVLDKLSYGNEGKSRGKARHDLEQMSEETILTFISLIEKVLAKNGYLFLWVDKFHLVNGIQKWLSQTPTLQSVDMITWNKGKMGMGYRTRRTCEYLIVIQKMPRQAKSTWTIHNIPDVWTEKILHRIHTHQKPLELQKQLILATTNEEDIVCDPAAGSYSVFECCKATNRNFIGCDIKFGETL